MRTSLRYLYPTRVSAREKTAPLGESGSAGLLVGVAVFEMALRRKVVVNRGMDWNFCNVRCAGTATSPVLVVGKAGARSLPGC